MEKIIKRNKVKKKVKSKYPSLEETMQKKKLVHISDSIRLLGEESLVKWIKISKKGKKFISIKLMDSMFHQLGPKKKYLDLMNKICDDEYFHSYYKQTFRFKQLKIKI